jgi:hypothetical protein
MELHQKLELVFDVDAVLRGQGADAALLRARRPRLVTVAEKARQQGLSFLQPTVEYKVFEAEGVQHERLLLQDGRTIRSRLIARHLAAASRLIVILATIGVRLEEHVSKIWEEDMVYALAMDGVGSAAVEALANAACQYFEQQAAEEGLQVSIPLSPGMVDWPVEDGQPQIFDLLGEAGKSVQLTSSYIMVPKKSLTMVIGVGKDMSSTGRTCDYCSMRATCRYQDHYSNATT